MKRFALLLTAASVLLAQNYGSTVYSYTNFPGEAWPTDPVPATSVSIGNPTDVAVDTAGNVYIAGPSIVFKLDRAGMLTRIAGNGHNGFAGDGGPATDALLGFPRAVPLDPIDWDDVMTNLALDAAGNLYIADMFNNRIRRIAPDGTISTVAGSDQTADYGVSARGDGGRATDARLWLPVGVAADANGNLFIADGFNIRRVGPDGIITSVAGNDCGSHTSSGVCAAEGIATDASGNVYVPDGYCRVRRIAPDSTITDVAGDARPGPYTTWTCGNSGDGGPATTAALSGPYGVAVGAAGDLYIADTYNNRIRKVAPDGTITTVAGSGPPFGGFYTGAYSGDGGPATDARLNRPHGVAIDSDGNIFIADSENFAVRKVTPDGIITTVAGNGVWCCFNQPAPGR